MRAHGVLGDVLVDPTGEDPERFAPGTRLWVDPTSPERLTVKSRRGNSSGYRVLFEGVPDRDAAEELKGVVLYQDPDALPKLPKGQYYHFQLVGLAVMRADGSRLGEITRVIAMPAGDLYQVQEGAEEWLIPGRPEFVDWIDLEKGEVRLQDRADLLEAVSSPNTPREHKGRQKRRFRRKPATKTSATPGANANQGGSASTRPQTKPDPETKPGPSNRDLIAVSVANTPQLRISILTGFPRMFEGPFDDGLLRIARESGQVEFRILNLREYTDDPHRSIDDYPYGGGPGMILKVEPVARALDDLPPCLGDRRDVVLLTPQGEPLTQKRVRQLLEVRDIVLLFGRYKGIDERIRSLVTREISLGDFILSGGELAAMVLADALTRLVPGVMGDIESANSDSFETSVLDSAYYTRPEEFREMRVPEVYLSGHHARIDAARRRDALERTLARRPDLLDEAVLDEPERAWLREQGWDPDSRRREGAALVDRPQGEDDDAGGPAQGHSRSGSD